MSAFRKVGLSGAEDEAVLEWAASQGRVLLTQDANTLTKLALDRVRAGKPMPGVIEIRRTVPIAVAVEELLIIAECSQAGEWEGLAAPPLRDWASLYLAAEMPTLIIWGEHDPLIPVAHAHSAHERIRESRLEIFANARHFPHRDDPQRFMEVLVDFIQSTASAQVDEQRWRERLRTGSRP